MRRTSLLAAVLLGAAATGCGTATVEPLARGGDEPTTARALAAVAAEHLGPPDHAVEEDDAAEEFRDGGVGAELRYGSDGEYDGDLVALAVGTGLPAGLGECPQEPELTGCVETSRGLLMWEGEAPESDPGVVYVVVPKDDSAVLLFYAGPVIDGDPRELELPVSVDQLFDLAHDPRVDVTTSSAAIAAGEGLEWWRD